RKQAEFNTLLLSGDSERETLLMSSQELEAQREKIAKLEAALEKAEDQRNLYQALSSDAATQEDRVATLNARIAVLEQQSGGLERDFEATRLELANTRAQMEVQRASAARAAAASESEIAARDEEVERLRAVVARAEQETDRHRSDIDRLNQQSLELTQLRAELEREQAQSNRLQQLLTDSQDRYAQSHTRLEEVSASYEKLASEVAALNAAEGSADAELLRQRESELQAAREELDALRASIATSEGEFQEYQLQMADTAKRQSQAIKDLRDAVAASRAERVELEEQLSEATQQITSAQADLEAERRRYTALQDELRAARVQGEADAKALAERQRELDSQTQQVASLQAEIERLNQQANRYASEINELQARTQAQKVDFVGPKIILAEPSEGGLGSAASTRAIGVAAAAAVTASETRSIRGHVDAPAGLASLVVNGMMVPFDSNNAFAQTVMLQGDKTPIRIVARDAKGKETTKEFEFLAGGGTVTKDTMLVVQEQPQQSILGDLRYYALLIANEDYENEDFASDLKTPVADVRGIGKILAERYGFEVEYLINAGYDEMADALERVIYREQKDDVQENDKDAILVYYAGHGFAGRVLGDNLRYYWMPVNAVNNSPRTWYETIEISKYLKESSIPQIMVVADSCYAGNLPSRDGMFDLDEPKHSPMFARTVRKRTKMRSRFVFTSGGNEPVLDDGGDGHSVFAREFMNVLLDNDTVLAAYELQGRVAPRVEMASAMIGKEQTPFFGYLGMAGHEFGDFYIPEPLPSQRQSRYSVKENLDTTLASSAAIHAR
ncbi:MAG: hypothetical protein HKN64_01385, partial [Woeseiaceae bacterium]|nr:hypothetical protein [Woeseiaceae bacterium]